jgi:phosphatidylinositol glycan class V
VITVPYTEVPFAALTFTAMFASVRRRYLLATLLFAAATSIRATGVFGAIVLAGHMMLARVGKEPFWRVS